MSTETLTAPLAPFTEPLVARVTGAKKSLLAHLRRSRLARPADWDLDGRRQVVYSRGGLMKLLTGLGIEFTALAWPVAETIENEAPVLETGHDDAPEVAVGEAGASVGKETLAKQATGSGWVATSEATLRVLRVDGPTRITARTLHGTRVALQVQSTANFIPGMTVPNCRCGPTGLWLLKGRLPRRPGRW